MYHLLIVEDEEIIRKALPLIIDWAEIGYSVIGTADSVAKALQILDETSVDVVLTDIKMPMVSGLELACELKSRFPAVKTILLSAYREFDFAQKGIEYGVYGYLLKTDSKADIREFFIRLKTELDRERLAQAYYRAPQGSPDHSDKWVQSRLFLRKLLLHDGAAWHELAREAMSHGVNLAHPSYTVAVFELDRVNEIVAQSGSEGYKALIAFLRNVVFSSVEIRQNGYAVEFDNRIHVLLPVKDTAARNILRQIFRDLSDEMEIGQYGRNLDITISGGVGNAVDNPLRIGESCRMATDALAAKVYLGGGSLLFSEDVGPSVNQGIDLSWMEAEFARLLALLGGKDFASIAAGLDTIEARLISLRIRSLGSLASCCRDLVGKAVACYSKLLPGRSVQMAGIERIEQHIAVSDTVQGMIACVKAFFDSLEEKPAERANTAAHATVGKALSYIRDHYATDMRLDEVAAHVNVHPVHLGRLLNAELSMTFKELLTKVRVDRAKELLCDPGYKVYEVSLAVGYLKPRYFSDLFKKVTGMTPLEYRESMR